MEQLTSRLTQLGNLFYPQNKDKKPPDDDNNKVCNALTII